MRRLPLSFLSTLLLSCAAPAQETPHSSLEQVLQAQDRDSHGDLRAVVVLREGAIVAERDYNGETAETLHDIRSAGKSITELMKTNSRLAMKTSSMRRPTPPPSCAACRPQQSQAAPTVTTR
jgi:hypothetical protein